MTYQPSYRGPDSPEVLVEPLTQREKTILALLGRGWTNRRIAAAQGLSVNTVKHHLKNIYHKLQVHNRTEAVWVGAQLDLIHPADPPARAEGLGGMRRRLLPPAGG